MRLGRSWGRLGMISNWKTCQLGELVTFTSGGTPSKKKAEYWNGSIPWISAKTMKDEHISTSDLMISEEGLKNGSRLAPQGSILFLIRGSGLFNGIPICLVDKPVAFNQDVKCINSISEIENKYVFYWLLSQASTLSAIVGVTTIGAGKFDMDVIKRLEISYPEKEVRNEIIRIADAISDKIRLNTAINENLESQAYLLLEQMLSTSHDDICTLSDIANINPRYTLPKGSEARYIDMSQLSTTASFPGGWAFRSYNGGMKFKNKDTIIARITPCLENGKTAYIDFLKENEIAFGSTEYIVLSPKDNIPPELLYCIVRYPEFRTYAKVNMNGSSGRQRVSGEIIGKYEIPSFTQKELSEFGAVAEPLFKQITENSLQNRNLSVLRDALLPKLMKGELDVSEVKI